MDAKPYCGKDSCIMAKRILWNDEEAALLLYALIEVREKRLDRKTAIREVSKTLRQFAVYRGMEIDDKFRNENGISLQMSALEYALTDGATGLPVKKDWCYRIVELYRNHPRQFKSVLKRFAEMKDNMEREPKIKEEKKPVPNKSSSADEIETVDLSLERDYSFTVPVSFSYFGETTHVTTWMELYVGCLRILYDDYPSVFKRLMGSPIIGNGRAEVGNSAASRFMVRPREIGKNVYVDTNYDTNKLMKRLHHLLELCNVDFENLQISFRRGTSRGHSPGGNIPQPKAPAPYPPVNIFSPAKTATLGESRSYTFTKPVSFTYQGQTYPSKNWKDLYVNCCKLLVNDHKRAFLRIMGRGILGGNKAEVADEKTVPSLLSPSEICDGIYVETNFSADDLMLRLGQLLVICKVDPNTVEVRYVERTRAESPQPQPKPPAAREKPAVPTVPPKVAENYISLLRDEFPYGMRQNLLHIDRFINEYEERFGEIPANRDNLLDELKAVGVVLDGRIYPPQDSSQRSLVDEIIETVNSVFEGGGSCVYLSKLLERYGRRLADQLGIYNEEGLQGILRERGGFFFRHGYIYTDPGNSDPAREILSFMEDRHTPVNYETLQSEFWYLPLDVIKHSLIYTPSLVKVGEESYFYAPNLAISPQELKVLSRKMDEEISAKDFLVAKDVKNLIDRYCPFASIDLSDMSDWAIRNCLGYLLRDKFEFNRAIISKKGHPMTTNEVFADFCQRYERLTLEQLKEFSEELDLSTYWTIALSYMVRVNSKELRRNDTIRFDIEKTDAVLDIFCPGDYVPIKDINLFLQFPAIDIPWNIFVLESYLRNFSARFKLVQVSAAEKRVCGVAVRRSSPLQDYEDIVVDFLARTYRWKNEAEALELIIEHGFQQRRQYANFGNVVKKAMLLREQIEKER